MPEVPPDPLYVEGIILVDKKGKSKTVVVGMPNADVVADALKQAVVRQMNEPGTASRHPQRMSLHRAQATILGRGCLSAMIVSHAPSRNGLRLFLARRGMQRR